MTPQDLLLVVGAVNVQITLAQIVTSKRSNTDYFVCYILSMISATCFYIGLTLY